MFFFLSKTIGALAIPSNLALLLLGVWGASRLAGRWVRVGVWALRMAVALLIVFSLPVTAHLIAHPLQSRHMRPHRPPSPVVAIAMLGGVTTASSTPYELNESADRFVEALRLARAYPRAKVMLLGGSGALSGGQSEAPVLAKLAVQLGVNKARLRVDSTSRNTHENALNGVRLLRASREKSGSVLLVTSAIHMPRALGCFNKAYGGPLRIVPWPADYQVEHLGPSSFLPRLRGLHRSGRLAKELAGLLAYKLAGYL